MRKRQSGGWDWNGWANKQNRYTPSMHRRQNIINCLNRGFARDGGGRPMASKPKHTSVKQNARGRTQGGELKLDGNK